VPFYIDVIDVVSEVAPDESVLSLELEGVTPFVHPETQP